MLNYLRVAATSIALLASFATQAQTVEKIVAIVDDNVVLASELEGRIQSVLTRYQDTGTEIPPLDVLTNQILERLILERIQLDMAARMGFALPEEELLATFNSVAASNGMTSEQFAQALVEQGSSVTQFLRDLRNEITLSELQQAAVSERIAITEAEIDAFLASDEGKFWQTPDLYLAHIQLELGGQASPEEVNTQQQLADDIYNQLLEGADFADMAARYSGGPSALQGGDLGWRKPAQFPSEIAEVLLRMEAGRITPPIRSAGGIHLFLVQEKRGGDARTMVQQTSAQHILIRPTEIRSDEAARQLIGELRARILAGEAFADLAREYSDDPGNALKGGDLGWVYPGQMVPEFENAMNLTPVGAVSEPVQTQFGWHLVKVNERKDVDVTDQVMRNQAANMIRNQRYEEELDIWLQEIRSEAFVEIVGAE